jgi:hypothetical protein
VANASESATEGCTHERRPGTTVCLRCRHEARIASRARRKRLMLRGSAVGVVVATLAIASVVSATALRHRGPSGSDATPASKPVPVAAAPRIDSTPAVAPTAPVVELAAKPAPVAPTIVPVIPQGETVLADGVTAFRVDSTVTLSFDLPMIRTRMADKFEQFVRATIPQLYGTAVDSALHAMPLGSIASQGNLITELPARGIHIPMKNRVELALYPETRPGDTGPIVVRYRVAAVVARD